MNYLIILILAICITNLLFLISLSNFLVRIADSISLIRKEIEEYYYINQGRNNKSENKTNNQESGLVDL